MRNNLTYKYFEGWSALYDMSFLRGLECRNMGLLCVCQAKDYRIQNPYLLFTNDLTLFLIQNESHSLQDLLPYDISSPSIFTFRRYQGSWEENISTFEEWLENDAFLFVQTNCARLPFRNTYASQDAISFSHHDMLIIGKDANNFYYIEVPWYTNKNAHIPYLENNTIGVVEKKILINATHGQLNYSVCNPQYNNVQNEKDLLDSIISKTIEHYAIDSANTKPLTNDFMTLYGKNRETLSHYKLSYGRNVFQNILQMFSGQFQDINEILQQDMVWLIGHIKNRRNSLLKGLLLFEKNHNMKISDDLLNLLSELVDNWSIITNIIRRMFIAEDYMIRSNIKNRILTALQQEDLLIIKLMRERERFK